MWECVCLVSKFISWYVMKIQMGLNMFGCVCVCAHELKGGKEVYLVMCASTHVCMCGCCPRTCLRNMFVGSHKFCCAQLRFTTTNHSSGKQSFFTLPPFVFGMLLVKSTKKSCKRTTRNLLRFIDSCVMIQMPWRWTLLIDKKRKKNERTKKS